MDAQITDHVFGDLYIGPDWADVVGLNGDAERIEVPQKFAADVEVLRRQCLDMTRQGASDEFSIRRGERQLLRVTSFLSTEGSAVYVVRRPEATILPLEQVGFGRYTIEYLLNPALRGLVLFSGEMRSGKTSAAASFTRARLARLGGTGIVIEDPPETALDGVLGRGRCIQVEVARGGGYGVQIKKAMRSGANLIYIGEVRDREVAAQVVTAAVNGHTIASTSHGGNPAEALQRLVAFCQGELEDAEALLASGLAAVLHLKLEDRKIPTATGEVTRKKLSYQMLEVANDIQVQNAIRAKAWHQIGNLMEAQAARLRAGAM